MFRHKCIGMNILILMISYVLGFSAILCLKTTNNNGYILLLWQGNLDAFLCGDAIFQRPDRSFIGLICSDELTCRVNVLLLREF